MCCVRCRSHGNLANGSASDIGGPYRFHSIVHSLCEYEFVWVYMQTTAINVGAQIRIIILFESIRIDILIWQCFIVQFASVSFQMADLPVWRLPLLYFAGLLRQKVAHNQLTVRMRSWFLCRIVCSIQRSRRYQKTQHRTLLTYSRPRHTHTFIRPFSLSSSLAPSALHPILLYVLKSQTVLTESMDYSGCGKPEAM